MHATLRRSALSLVLSLAVAASASAEEGLVFVDAAAGLPDAVPLQDDFRHEPLCEGADWMPETTGERALAARGWLLTAAPVVWGEFRFVTGSAGVGGQCRTMDNRIFVFRKDEYLGHAFSPDKQTRLSIKLDPTGTVEFGANYRRPGDPNCCPSGEAVLDVQVFRLKGVIYGD